MFFDRQSLGRNGQMNRGTFGFEVTADGNLVDCAANVELLRKLWLDRTMIDGADLGEGDPGDFDHGAWHIACHLAAAGGVLRAEDGRLLWAEISHICATDRSDATVTTMVGDSAKTWPIASAEGRGLVHNSTVLGFIEGNSLGRTSARGVNDTPTLFNLWRRQDFDQPVGSTRDGGKVWEHWCTTRDIRPSCEIGTSVVSAYVCLVAAIADLFPALVARGRSDYGHPKQLCALVNAGFVSEDSALSEKMPTALPATAEKLLLQSCSSLALEAVEQLEWEETPRYYMFPRRIDKWCPTAVIRDELQKMTAT